MRIKKNFVMNTIDNKSVVACTNGEFDGIIILDDMGILIWNLLEKECNFDDIVSYIGREYDVEYEILKNDIKKFLNDIKFAIDGDIK